MVNLPSGMNIFIIALSEVLDEQKNVLITVVADWCRFVWHVRQNFSVSHYHSYEQDPFLILLVTSKAKNKIKYLKKYEEQKT